MGKLPRSIARVCVWAACAGAVLGMAACRGDRSDAPPREFFPDMKNQPRWNPQEATGFFADGRTDRVPPPQTVAFGRAPFDPETYGEREWAESFLRERATFAKDDRRYFEGVDPESDVYLDYIPGDVSVEMIERGRERFNIYCAACHGYVGDGQGAVGLRWSYPPSNLLTEAYTDRAQRTGKDGYLFHVIRDGVWSAEGESRMPGYAHAVDEHDAWAIVAYIRALQRSQTATIEDAPRRLRADLERLRLRAAQQAEEEAQQETQQETQDAEQDAPPEDAPPEGAEGDGAGDGENGDGGAS